MAAVRQIFFKDARGLNLHSIDTEQYNFGDTMELEEGEEIVGIYGSHYIKGFINYIGFIVWKP